MKKPAVGILVLVTCVFVSFAAGFFMARNLNRSPVRIAPIAAVTEASAPAGTAPAGPTEPVIVNINTAPAAQLEGLPGIGPVLAERIAAYREENGSFQATEELTRVKGIGQATLEEILDLITVGG